jgi:hypothetical protein
LVHPYGNSNSSNKHLCIKKAIGLGVRLNLCLGLWPEHRKAIRIGKDTKHLGNRKDLGYSFLYEQLKVYNLIAKS